MATEANLIVILERSIKISTYQGLSLQTRFDSTVCVDPNYPQAVELINWAKENKKNVVKLCVRENLNKLICPSQDSDSCWPTSYLYCRNVISSFRCKQKKRTKDKKAFECPKCNRKTTLVPWCIFQIDLIDGTATTITSISAELGEKLLSMTVEDIFDITCAKMLSNKLFQIQLRKSSWGSSNSTHATLSIFSYMEKEHTPQRTTDRNSKNIRPLEISEVEVMATTTTTGSSNATTPKFEPPTPTKIV